MTEPATVSLDLNADLGEGFGIWRLTDDDALLEVVSSANVACGAHAGDPSTMRAVCARAAQLGVRIGAHVGYADLAGFGRRFVDVEPARLRDEVVAQIAALQAFATLAGTAVTYVKPHGALYNAIVEHRGQAYAVAAGVAELCPGLPVLGLENSAWLTAAAEAGLRPVAEAYADRGYRPDGQLVSRQLPGAVLTDPAAVVDRVRTLARTGTVEAVDGTRIAVAARSVCVHGDTPGAAGMAAAVRSALLADGVQVESFVPAARSATAT
jgi:UPF0271 protein